MSLFSSIMSYYSNIITLIYKGHNPLGYMKLFMLFVVSILMIGAVSAAQSAVNLGTAGNFVILAKSGISTTGTTSIVGDIGVSPAAASYITGFGLIADSSNTFSTSSLVTGKIYAADYTAPTPTTMTTAISDMETAYTDAAGRTETNIVTELGAGDISGKTIAPGLYKWGTGVLINNGVTLSGGANDIWIFQIAQDLTVGNGAIITLSGGAQPKNIFWQVAGQTTLGTTSNFKGIILCQTLIEMQTGATLNGRALAQTAVTLDANAVTVSGTASTSSPPTTTPPSSGSSSGGSVGSNSGTTTSTSSNSASGDTGTSGSTASAANPNGIVNIVSGVSATITRDSKTIEITSVDGRARLKSGDVKVEIELPVEAEGNIIRVTQSNGAKAEIKIMPSTASETALARLRLKVCNEANNCTIILKEVGIGAETELVYQVKAQKNVRILGLFKAKMNVEVNVDAETGNIISEHKPWWAFIATESAE